MKILKLKKPSYHLFYLLAAVLLLAMIPLIATARDWNVNIVDCVATNCVNAFQPKMLGSQFDHPLQFDKVTWTNNGTTMHTVTGEHAMGDYEGNLCHEDSPIYGGDPSHLLNSGYLQPGQTYSFTFAVPSFCYYRCILYPPPAYSPPMEGVIAVNPPPQTTTTMTTTPTTTSTTTTTTNHPPTAVGVAPAIVTSGPSIPQSFTATYSDPDGWQNIAAVSFSITANGKDGHNQGVFYNKTLNRFTLLGAGGNCNPGQAATISSLYLSLNCSASSISGSGNTLTMTFSLTPQPIFPGPHPLSITVADQTGAGNSKNNVGKWTVHRSKD